LPDDAEPPSAEDAAAAEEEAEAAAAGDEGEGEAEEGSRFGTLVMDLTHRDFEGGTNVTAVMTSHHMQPQTSGRVAIYFYPNGQAERALVWVGAAGESPTGWVPEITVELHSLGRVTWHPDPVEENDFDLERPEEIE
jgi:hypothetical protein